MFEVPEVCAVQVIPSDEVSRVPAAPTAINNPLDVVLVVVLSVLVLLSSLLFLAQEMTVRLKRDMRIMYNLNPASAHSDCIFPVF